MGRTAPLFVFALLVLAAGCSRETPTPEAEPEPATGKPESAAAPEPAAAAKPRAGSANAHSSVGSYSFNAYSYDCGELQVVVEPGEADMRVYLPDRSVLLPQIEAASGARYGEEDVGFWGKGINTALLTLDGEDVPCTLNRLRTPWDAARVRGVVFRAIGQEPGWLIEIAPDSLEVQYAYGQARVTAPVPDAPPASGDEIWRFRDETRDITVSLVRETCTDPMNGEEYPWRAEVTLPEQTFSGCGQVLE